MMVSILKYLRKERQLPEVALTFDLGYSTCSSGTVESSFNKMVDAL